MPIGFASFIIKFFELSAVAPLLFWAKELSDSVKQNKRVIACGRRLLKEFPVLDWLSLEIASFLAMTVGVVGFPLLDWHSWEIASFFAMTVLWCLLISILQMIRFAGVNGFVFFIDVEDDGQGNGSCSSG